MTENEECMYEKFGICHSLMMNTCMYEKVPMRKLAESLMLTVCVRYQHNSDAVDGNKLQFIKNVIEISSEDAKAGNITD